jgi:GNAT superfamily N-acetyltransferase
VTSPFHIRLATVADAEIVARHRAEMFADMGQLPSDLYADLEARTIRYLRDALPKGEYIGWLASTASGEVVAGAGVQLRRLLPHPMTRAGEHRIADGRQAIVLNVFSERAWRRRGLAALLMARVMEWARDAEIDTLVLHASDEGRALYERLGFVQTNEMRYARPLRRS